MKFKLLGGVLLTIMLGLWWWPVRIDHPPTQWYFYDRHDQLLYSETQGSDSLLTEYPSQLKDFIIALEDKHFRNHWGVDFKAVARAAGQNLKQQRVVSGASTITMQLARLLYLSDHERNRRYKLQQMFWALKLEQNYTKPEILDLYLSKVPLGHGTQGFASAAQRYFSKSLDQLSTGEIALLLAMVPNPSLFNPIDHPQRAQERRNLVLERLQSVWLLTQAEVDFWKAQPIILNPQLDNAITAPHFVFWLQSQLSFLADQSTVIKVYTTLDKKLYEDTLTIARETIERQSDKKMSNAAVVVLDDQNEIKVMLGSVDYFNAGIQGAVNMATAPRQTGSVLKPFLYALALEKGWSPATGLRDVLTIFPGGYWPRNFDIDEENGVVRFREALANSYNIAAVDLLNRTGVGAFHFFLQTLGLEIAQTDTDLGLSLVLGSGESSLLNLTQGYSAFSHQGKLIAPRGIRRVENDLGATIFKPAPSSPKKVFSSSTAEWGQHVLSDQAARWKNFSRGNSLELPFPSSAKTGTSQAFRDNWVLGFSPSHTVGVWVGNADGTPMVASSGMQGAGPLWQKVMQRVHQNRLPQPFIYQSDRRPITLCRRPGETNCAEQVTAFLTPAEQAALNDEATVTDERFSITYPRSGDTFVAGSDLLLQYRPDTAVVKSYTLNGIAFEGPIVKNLPPGASVIKLETLDGNSAIVQIQTENL